MIDMAAINAELDKALEYGFVEDAESKDWRAFNKLMPKLYAARNRGMSYLQMTELLRAHGLNLDELTVKFYYTERLHRVMDECKDMMASQIKTMRSLIDEHKQQKPM